jgi:hypothetical protein
MGQELSIKTSTYLLTPWSRILLEKLTGSQLVKKFSPFCGTRMFITAFTNANPSTKHLICNKNPQNGQFS